MLSRLVNISLILISATVISFEVLSTRIASVIFVNNYAFMILSFAILGLGAGGIFSYYRLKKVETNTIKQILFRLFICISASYLIFILITIFFEISNQFIFFVLLFPSYFFSGIFYAVVFREFSSSSFKIYAYDLIGAAFGAVFSILLFYIFTATMAILFISILVILFAFIFYPPQKSKLLIRGVVSILLIGSVAVVIMGKSDLLPKVPIGMFDEKDFHYVYENVRTKSNIVDSRWSIYGRSDLVEYSHQDLVKQLFIDGAAGSPMYKFNGDITKITPTLYNMLISSTTTVPLLSLRAYEKETMLVIGPGGGKEVLTGLLTGVGNITGIEINKDFIEIVKSQNQFNGGIYSKFRNVKILAKEGRHFIKETKDKYDLIVMALPSTEQIQSIDNFAMNENYLLTVEAIQDYLNVLTPEGRLVFTVHNRWELIRLLTTSLYAFNEKGISNRDAMEHIALYGSDYAPTIVIKKDKFSREETKNISNINSKLPNFVQRATYLPFNKEINTRLVENKLVATILNSTETLENYIAKDRYDITPNYDDSPYFYKIERGVPEFYMNLFWGVLVICLLVAGIPLLKAKKKLSSQNFLQILKTLSLFMLLGAGFMILEVSLFQKLILYLGSPTISLSVLLASLLIGMGFGSFFCKKILPNNLKNKIMIGSVGVLVIGLVVYFIYPPIFNELLTASQLERSLAAFVLILPLGMVLGVPFPSVINLLDELKLDQYIPWMYGINGIMSVLGSILAVIFSMLLGFNLSFIIGLFCYLIILIISSRIKGVLL